VSPGVEEKPYLHYCEAFPGHFDIDAGSCVSHCSDAVACSGGISYEAKTLSGKLCLPLSVASLQDIDILRWEVPKAHLSLVVASSLSSWQPFALVSLGTAIFGVSFLAYLDEATGTLLWLPLTGSVLFPAVLGSYFLLLGGLIGTDSSSSSTNHGLGSRSPSHLSFSPNHGLQGLDEEAAGIASSVSAEFVAGLLFLLLAFATACRACLKAAALQVPRECIEATLECLRDMPTLIFTPLFLMIMEACLALCVIVGGVLFARVNTVDKHKDSFTLPIWPHWHVSAAENSNYFLGFYGIVALWELEVSRAFGQFVAAYVTQKWYFERFRQQNSAKLSPTCSGCTGWWVGVAYHLGTLAFGSLCISLARFPRFLLSGLPTQDDADRNMALSCLAKCCCCCSSCFETVLKPIYSTTYIEVAASGSEFCEAAGISSRVLSNESTGSANLIGSTSFYESTTVIAVASGGALVSLLLVRGLDVYSSTNSPNYVEDPLFVAIVSGVVCAKLVSTFTLIVQQVPDTILYCYALEQRRTNFGFLPLALDATPETNRQNIRTEVLLRRAKLSAPQYR